MIGIEVYLLLAVSRCYCVVVEKQHEAQRRPPELSQRRAFVSMCDLLASLACVSWRLPCSREAHLQNNEC